MNFFYIMGIVKVNKRKNLMNSQRKHSVSKSSKSSNYSKLLNLLNDRGYCLLPNAIDIDSNVISSLRYKAKHARYIFNGKHNDKKRKQVSINTNTNFLQKIK